MSRYVRRVMQEKQLKVRDVELRSGGQISNGYVSGIMSGSVTNLSVDKIKALARGLGVELREVFDVICGPRARGAEGPRLDPPQLLEFLDLMQRVAASRELLEILEESVLLSSDERLIVLKYVKKLNHSKNRSQAKRRHS